MPTDVVTRVLRHQTQCHKDGRPPNPREKMRLDEGLFMPSDLSPDLAMVSLLRGGFQEPFIGHLDVYQSCAQLIQNPVTVCNLATGSLWNILNDL